MKTFKHKDKNFRKEAESLELKKARKMALLKTKINPKSPKFWDEILDDEDEVIPLFRKDDDE
jgi:hypothetical protein